MPVPIPWIHAFIDVPEQHADTARTFWSAATGTTPGSEWDEHPEFQSLTPPAGSPYLHVQVIDGPPRIHLDLIGDRTTDVPRLEGLGATLTHAAQWWHVLRSPAGLPFCVVGESKRRVRPPAATWPGGHRSRLVQLCIDVPADLYDAEAEFWHAATGWAEERVDAPEYRRFVHRDTSPMQLLVQRLGADDPGRTARAHLDLGADDLAAETDRLVGLGATVRRSDEIVVLADPMGLPFCITGNDPG